MLSPDLVDQSLIVYITVMQTPSHCPDYCVETLRGSTCFQLAGPYIITFILYYTIICLVYNIGTYTHIPANNLIHAHLKCYLAHILTRWAKTTYVRGGAVWVLIFKKKKMFFSLNPSKLPTRVLYLFVWLDCTPIAWISNCNRNVECLYLYKCIYVLSWTGIEGCSSKRCRYISRYLYIYIYYYGLYKALPGIGKFSYVLKI